jgi:hypothetical protein
MYEKFVDSVKEHIREGGKLVPNEYDIFGEDLDRLRDMGALIEDLTPLKIIALYRKKKHKKRRLKMAKVIALKKEEEKPFIQLTTKEKIEEYAGELWEHISEGEIAIMNFGCEGLGGKFTEADREEFTKWAKEFSETIGKIIYNRLVFEMEQDILYGKV